MSVLSLPAIWTGGDSSQVITTLLDALVGMLRLDFAYARFLRNNKGSETDVLRVAKRQTTNVLPQDVGQALKHCLMDAPPNSPALVANPIGKGEVLIAPFRLGLHDEIGFLAAASKRRDFPTKIETLLLRVAANQAVVGLQEAQFISDQKRSAEELERKIAERTRQVTAVNIELFREVDERERAEEELRRSEAFLAEGQRISHTGSWAVKFPSGDVFWSREVYRIYGVDPDATELSQEMAFQLVHPEDRTFVQEAFERAVRERGDYVIEHRAIVPDGTIKHLHAVGHPVVGASGDLVECVGTVVDITERKRAEEKLGESERRFRLLVESIPHHVWSFRPDDTVGYWNQRLIDYTGLTPEEIQAGGWAALHPDDVVRVKAAWQEAWANGGAYEMEQRIRGRDGHYRRFVCSAVAVKDEHGRPAEWFGTDTDVEARRQAEEALHKAQAELAHVARVTTLGELTASIAHEVNQPLAAIVTNGQASLRLLSRSKPDIDEAREALESIIADSLRASEVIKRIRALLRKTGPAKSRLNINEAIREVIAFTAGELKKNHASLVTELAPDLPTVIGDRVQLQQVMLNLIINGNEAMNSPDLQTRELLVRSQRTGPDGVLVIVKDTGTGLDPNDRERVFDAFFTRKEGGLGLGLSISRTIIEDHGGKLWATSNEGPGVSLQFLLPPASKTNDEQN